MVENQILEEVNNQVVEEAHVEHVEHIEQVENVEQIEQQSASQIDPNDNQEDHSPDHVSEDTDQKGHFRRLREAKERAERERDELVSLLRKNSTIQQEAPPEENIDLSKLDSDDLVEGKHLNALNKKIRQLELANQESRLRSNHQDFDKVVNEENISKLKQLYPHLAKMAGSSSNLYEQGSTAYSLIKNLIVDRDAQYKPQKKVAAENFAKPRSVSSLGLGAGKSSGERANGFYNGLTNDILEQERKAMEAAIRNRQN